MTTSADSFVDRRRTERRRFETSVWREAFVARQEQQIILDTVPAMIWYKDTDNRILRCNRAAAQWYGKPAEELEGRSADELFPGRGADYRRDDLAVIRSGKARRGLIEECLSPTGKKCWVRRDLLPYFDENGRLMGVIVFAVDITEIKRAQDALRESERAQRDFVANVSHEFRTPVAAIKGYAETLRRGGIHDRKNRLAFIRVIESHADRLDWLVQDLLNLSRLGTGMVTFSLRRLPVRRFLEDYLKGIKPLLSRRAVSVEVEASPSLAVHADRPHLVQVMDNLVGNALKHSPRGSVIRLAARGQGAGARLTVADQGGGIPAEHLSRIFDRFFRVEGRSSNGDSGLGLHIVKTIVEAHGGRVWAESVLGRGSAFHLTLRRWRARPTHR